MTKIFLTITLFFIGVVIFSIPVMIKKQNLIQNSKICNIIILSIIGESIFGFLTLMSFIYGVIVNFI